MTTDIQTVGSEASDLLALIPDGTIQEVPQEVVDAMVKSGDWLPRIQLTTSGTNLVKEGKAEQGKFYLIVSNDNLRNLGDNMEFVSFAMRPRAMRFTNPPLSYFDRQDPEFQKIQVESEGQNAGCAWGPEFLVWLPVPGVFALFFLNNPTLRRAAPGIITEMAVKNEKDEVIGLKPASILAKVELIKRDKLMWHGANFFPLSTPVAKPTAEDWPERLKEQLEKFRNPPKNTVTKDTAPASRER